ncbi:MAG: nucleotidyl transferase AbiEii/AbiGii toxin family protein [Chloroflexota bacterium]
MSNIPVPPAIARIAPDGNLTPRQLRRFMIDMVKRRVRPGTGSSAEFMRRRTAMNPWPDLRPILQGIDWVIIGGVATRAYMPERATKDLDILVHQGDGEAVLERLKQAGYRVVSRLAIPGYLLLSPEGVEIDVVFGNYPWLREALAHPKRDPAGYPVISLPYLVILKMAAQRARDLGDLGTILGWASEAELDAVRAAVARYAPEDLEDLESLIFIGKKEQEIPPAPEADDES